MSTFLQIAVSVIIAQLAGIIGAFATRSSVGSWYKTLDKPWFTPPNWLFGPAWITLYTLMGVAAWLVWRKGGFSDEGVRVALIAYGVQLVINAAWSPAFFGARSPMAGLVIIAVLWVAIIVTIYLFAQHSKAAAWLLAPYLAWVTYASALNFEIWRLN
ncbi:tryptophan-rich sensory protein [Persicimonas caeni]|jgi:tryptophan-rich sensory protein|uniref:Tryptophan-rich sensory protein n=1 Tax=Persicimonas caeni TaxID=2292766 RepID=A0A4Y6PLI0_PERCE|nr:TspO/MBR family protein [Persicimonas caeni]QDG49186.1 tryptophan-rich sensory protein [Persicimonas caeni]QED30407.1 tryptophan-rich sensory protein [Persicimonas caeni]